jgi:hypothetical protein
MFTSYTEPSWYFGAHETVTVPPETTVVTVIKLAEITLAAFETVGSSGVATATTFENPKLEYVFAPADSGDTENKSIN